VRPFRRQNPGFLLGSFCLEELEKDSYRLSYQSRGVYCRQNIWKGIRSKSQCFANLCTVPPAPSVSRPFATLDAGGEGELEAAMLLGHKQGLRDSVQDSFRTAGVSHLLAVSGLHVALFCGIFSFGVAVVLSDR
jgi:competence protein ComEC